MTLNVMGSKAGGGRIRALAVTAVCVALIAVPLVKARAAIAVPTITTPAQGSLKPGAPPSTVKIAGKATAGSSVEVFEGLMSLGSATASGTGTWSKQAPFTEGQHTIYAIATDPSTGETSPPSGTVTFDVDTSRPVARVTAPEDAHVYQPGETIVIKGSSSDDRGVLGMKVDYYQLDKLILRSTADCTDCGSPSASWRNAPSLQPGYYVVKVTAVDTAGNQSDPVQRSFLAGLENAPPPPQPPTVQLPEAPTPPVITTPDPKDLVPATEKPVTIGGSTVPRTDVTVIDNKRGQLGPEVTSDRKGSWKLTMWLPSGSYSVRAIATDSQGDMSPVSKLLTFIVDADRPQVAVLTEDDTAFLPTQPVRLEGRVLDNRRVASVYVQYWLLDKLALTDKARCPGCSTQEAVWSDKPKLDTPGYYYVKVVAFDQAGNISYVSATHIIKAG